MTKLGINVGEDFPAEEVPQPERGSEGHVSCDHEELRARARAFKDDVRQAARKHFGEHSFTAHNAFVLPAVLAVSLLALSLAVLPHVLLLALPVVGIVFFMAHRGHFHRHDYYDTPHNGV
jgi:hypothetical protein